MSVDASAAARKVVEASSSTYDYYVSRMAENLAQRVESNIELMMLVAFGVAGMFAADSKGRPLYSISPTDQPNIEGWPSAIVITPQCKWEGYRIDFRLDFQFLEHPIFIECDGHDFHERTKEQAERDRRKDRLFQEAGIPILRFTGREIFRDPMQCVTQITDFIGSRMQNG